MAETKGSIPGDIVQDQLVRVYVHNEEVLLARSRIPLTDKVIQEQDRILSEVGESGIFILFPTDDDKRRKMRETALTASKDFWVRKMEEPSLSSTAIALGRKRIDTIDQRLEALTKLPQNKKP